MKNRIGNLTIFKNNLKIDFMGQAKPLVLLSMILVLASVVMLSVRGLNYSIDFLGGTEINFSTTDSSVHSESIKEIVAEKISAPFEVNEFTSGAMTSNAFVVRLQRDAGQAEDAVSGMAEEIASHLQSRLADKGFELGSITNISGKIGKEEERKGYLSLLMALGGILLYVWFRFDLRFAPGAVACLFHDVILALAIMTLLGRPFDVGSIAAFLTVIGYSMNDTVIVYDRIRETLTVNPRLHPRDAINLSINQTLNRTVLTSMSTIIALVVLVYFGGGSIEDFALTMLIGVLVGTYSSIYIAAPLALFVDNFCRARGIQLTDPNKKKEKKEVDYCPPVVLKKRPSSASKGS